MRKKIEWSDRNRPVVSTGCKACDKQINYLGVGNIWACCQFSNYIRGYNDTLGPDGKSRAPGQLTAFDLAMFGPYLPTRVCTAVQQLVSAEPGILYLFRHRKRGTPPVCVITHGFILTTAEPECRLLGRWITDTNQTRGASVIAALLPYVADMDLRPLAVTQGAAHG